MEGFAPSIYKDVVGVKSIGYGLTGKEIEGLNDISEEKATQLLTKYVNDKYFSKVLSIIKSKRVSKFLQREVDVFDWFAYNLGIGAFQSSTLLKKYAKGMIAFLVIISSQIYLLLIRKGLHLENVLIIIMDMEQSHIKYLLK